MEQKKTVSMAALPQVRGGTHHGNGCGEFILDRQRNKAHQITAKKIETYLQELL